MVPLAVTARAVPMASAPRLAALRAEPTDRYAERLNAATSEAQIHRRNGTDAEGPQHWHSGATLTSSAAGTTPLTSSSDKPHPGLATDPTPSPNQCLDQEGSDVRVFPMPGGLIYPSTSTRLR